MNPDSENGAAHGPWAHQERLAQLGPALCDCAAHVETGSMEKAANSLARAMGLLAGNVGGPLRRLAAPMADCLARRLLRPIPGVADALIDPSQCNDRRCVRSARRTFFELSPFPKAAFAVSNRAIVEATENEKNVHVIDFAGPSAQPRQWIELLHDFHRRPEGPPHLRLTVVHDDRDFLAKASKLLDDEAEELDMALFQFHGVVGQLETLDFNDLYGILQLKSGEAIAISCTQQLHRLLATADDSTSSSFSSAHQFNNQMTIIARLQQMASSSSYRPPMNGEACQDNDELNSSPATPLSFVSPPASTPPPFPMPAPLANFLSAAHALFPKVMVITEHDANHNGLSFRKRFAEALQYYAAVYGSLAAAAAAYGRPAAELAEVERAVLGEEIRGVLLREGARRRERHDRLQQWAARMETAGYRNVPLSYVAIRKGNKMLRRCGVRGCASRQHEGCLLLCWSSWPLYSISAWRPNGGEQTAGGTEYLSPSSHMHGDPAHSL